MKRRWGLQRRRSNAKILETATKDSRANNERRKIFSVGTENEDGPSMFTVVVRREVCFAKYERGSENPNAVGQEISLSSPFAPSSLCPVVPSALQQYQVPRTTYHMAR